MCIKYLPWARSPLCDTDVNFFSYQPFVRGQTKNEAQDNGGGRVIVQQVRGTTDTHSLILSIPFDPMSTSRSDSWVQIRNNLSFTKCSPKTKTNKDYSEALKKDILCSNHITHQWRKLISRGLSVKRAFVGSCRIAVEELQWCVLLGESKGVMRK